MSLKALGRLLLSGAIVVTALTGLNVPQASAHTTWCNWASDTPYGAGYRTVWGTAHFECYFVDWWGGGLEPVHDRWIEVSLEFSSDDWHWWEWGTTSDWNSSAATNFRVQEVEQCTAWDPWYIRTYSWQANIDTHGYFGSWNGPSSSEVFIC